MDEKPPTLDYQTPPESDGRAQGCAVAAFAVLGFFLPLILFFGIAGATNNLIFG